MKIITKLYDSNKNNKSDTKNKKSFSGFNKDKCRILMIIGITLLILIIGMIFLYPSFKEGFAGEAVKTKLSAQAKGSTETVSGLKSSTIKDTYLSKEICANKKDDDGDKLIDCKDPDCYKFGFTCCNWEKDCKNNKNNKICSNEVCIVSAKEICDNYIDDDGDGFIDCATSECYGELNAKSETCCRLEVNPTENHCLSLMKSLNTKCVNDVCIKSELFCNDNIDNDGDNLVDCEDKDCSQDTACLSGKETTTKIQTSSIQTTDGVKEICDNYIDDDGDGFTDCNDPDCAKAEFTCCSTDNDCKSNNKNKICVNQICIASAVEICNNQKDDDGDKLVDCKDPDCSKIGFTCCTKDKDCKSKTNTICSKSTVCIGAEICTNGKDDDGDGFTDCADSNCFGKKNAKQETCCQVFDTSNQNDLCNNYLSSDKMKCVNNVCTIFESLCDDNEDNDKDGLVDCKDPDCCSYETGSKCPLCGKFEFICGDNIDDDSDGKIDCVDDDCAESSVCLSTQAVQGASQATTQVAKSVSTFKLAVKETVCDDKLDNDGDMLIDCADDDCISNDICIKQIVQTTSSITQPIKEISAQPTSGTSASRSALSCTPNCQHKVCGDDGCGGSCGSCGVGQTCKDGTCVVSPVNVGSSSKLSTDVNIKSKVTETTGAGTTDRTKIKTLDSTTTTDSTVGTKTGAEADNDKDGVLDSDDKCPDTPTGKKVYTKTEWPNFPATSYGCLVGDLNLDSKIDKNDVDFITFFPEKFFKFVEINELGKFVDLMIVNWS